MSPVPATEGTVRARPEDEAQRDLQVLNSGVMTTGRLQRGSAESDIGRIFADANGLFSSPHGQASLATIELTPNDHDRLLELYDSEFCVLPLTGDISANPFRCKRQTLQGSRLLFHSMLALCCQHMKRITGSWSNEAEEHRHEATQLLDAALQKKELQNPFSLLEPILILFTLDCALSAIGNWSKHLSRAHSILWACGGPSALTNARVRSQVSMLVWWDATLALISRQGTIIDHAYLDFLIKWEKQDDWSFFDLTGCPGDLLIHLCQLTELVHQSEIARSMRWLNFDITPVLEIEMELTKWNNNVRSSIDENPMSRELSDAEREQNFHKQQDRYHCAEAWRRTSQTQKQLLLPVFLAGSVTSDQDTREFVKDYCTYWGEKSRYSMFNSVPLLLDEVWSSGKWWGAVVDNETRTPALFTDQGATQLLLG